MNPMTAAKRVTTDGSARASVVTAPSTTAPSAQQQRQDLRAKRGVYNSEAFPAVHIRKGEEEEDELDLHGHPTQAWEQRSDDSDEVPSRAGNVEPFVEPDDGPEPPLTLVIPPSSSTLEKHRSARSRLATSSTQSLSDRLSTSLPRQNSVSVSPQRKSAFSRYVTSTPLSNGSPRIASTSASIGNHMESPSQLPPSDDEWVLSTDTVSGCEYYYNRVTGKSSWYHPGRPLWKRCVDTSTGQPYWFNVATRESSWTEPIQDNAQQGTPLSRKQSTKALDSSSAWTCVYTDKGVPYYWNSETGQSSWTNPTGSQA